MPNFRDRRTVAAASTVQNVLAGSAFEFLARPSRVQVWVTRDAVAGLDGDVKVQVQFGSEIQLENADVPRERVTEAGPSTDDPPLADDVGAAGDRLVVRISNSDAVLTPIVQTFVRIVPLG